MLDAQDKQAPRCILPRRHNCRWELAYPQQLCKP